MCTKLIGSSYTIRAQVATLLLKTEIILTCFIICGLAKGDMDKLGIAKLIGSGLGVGYAPKAPGTFGSLFGLLWLLPVSYFLGDTIYLNYFIILLIIVGFIKGLWASNIISEAGEKDPGWVIVDEMVGMWITLLFVPLTPVMIITGFALFRLFDITKPSLIGKADKELKGGLGIMVDDVLAGIAANFCLQMILLL